MIPSVDTPPGHDDIDEYLWPLTNSAWPISWARAAEELRLRQRLCEILTHVTETHVAPRLRRLRINPTSPQAAAVMEGIIAGPGRGDYWERTLRDPVPRALRDEWRDLTTALRSLRHPRQAVPS